jgi:REP element-mobilizing transposase RayT
MRFKRLPHVDARGLMQHVVFCTHGAYRDDEDDDAMGKSPHGRVLNGRLADRVQEVLLNQHGEDYVLHAWCVMPNHVHVLVQPRDGRTLKSIVQVWKSVAAHAPNAPKPLWQKNYFDRFMRDDEQVWVTVNYIEANPVAAGFVVRKEDWRWSSAWGGG